MAQKKPDPNLFMPQSLDTLSDIVNYASNSDALITNRYSSTPGQSAKKIFNESLLPESTRTLDGNAKFEFCKQVTQFALVDKAKLESKEKSDRYQPAEYLTKKLEAIDTKYGNILHNLTEEEQLSMKNSILAMMGTSNFA